MVKVSGEEMAVPSEPIPVTTSKSKKAAGDSSKSSTEQRGTEQG